MLPIKENIISFSYKFSLYVVVGHVVKYGSFSHNEVHDGIYKYRVSSPLVFSRSIFFVSPFAANSHMEFTPGGYQDIEESHRTYQSGMFQCLDSPLPCLTKNKTLARQLCLYDSSGAFPYINDIAA